jgi:type IV secretion system protein VirD4
MIMSDTKKTYHFLIAILEAQLMNMLCDMAFKMKNGKLRVHVRLLLDEFANSVTRSTPKAVGITDKSVA